jgi:stage III sporulation protein AA
MHKTHPSSYIGDEEWDNMTGEELLLLLPVEIRTAIRQAGIPPGKLQEIRIRAGRPVILKGMGQEKVLDGIGTVRGEQVRDILSCLGKYSLYAYEEELRQGFLSLQGGHRVGVCGKVVQEQGRIRSMSEIAFLNIRFAHEVRGCADEILPKLWDGERLLPTLIASAPGQGKTTLLRDCVRQISDGGKGQEGKTVGLVDERSEIAGCFRGIPGNDVGMRTDVLDGCPKAEGMLLLIRSMAPQVVAVDEIGSMEDLEAIKTAANCGCILLATVHGSCMEELLRKPVLKKLVKTGIFERYVFLANGKVPGRVRQILNREGKEC